MGNVPPNGDFKNDVTKSLSKTASLTSLSNSLRRSLRRRLSSVSEGTRRTSGDGNHGNSHLKRSNSTSTTSSSSNRKRGLPTRAQPAYGESAIQQQQQQQIQMGKDSSVSDESTGSTSTGDGDADNDVVTYSRVTRDSQWQCSNNTTSSSSFRRRSHTLQTNSNADKQQQQAVGNGARNCHVSFSLSGNRPASVCGTMATAGGKDIWLESRLRLDKYMTSKWISGIAVTKRGEFAIVDLKEAFLVDRDGQFKRQLGNKGMDRLLGPIGVTSLPGGGLAFSDHVTQDVKVFTTKGQHVATVRNVNFSNIAGISADEAGRVYVAGADRKQIFVMRCADGDGEAAGQVLTIPSSAAVSSGGRSLFDHPYSVACCSRTGDVIVGDDSRQMVTAISGEDSRVLWRFCPPGHGQRHFFPSSIAVDETAGVVFIADLYNEKVYAVDMATGAFIKTVLARGDELKGGPSAIAVDGCGHLLVADEEKTLKVFGYDTSSFSRITPSSSNGSLVTLSAQQQQPKVASSASSSRRSSMTSSPVVITTAKGEGRTLKVIRHSAMLKTNFG